MEYRSTTVLVEVNKHEVWVSALFANAETELLTEGICTGYSIGLISLTWVRSRLAKDQSIQKVINKVHRRGSRGIGVRPVHTAVKCCGDVIRSFPDISEFVNDIRNGVKVSVGVHESYQSRSRIDEAAKGRPTTFK